MIVVLFIQKVKYTLTDTSNTEATIKRTPQLYLTRETVISNV